MKFLLALGLQTYYVATQQLNITYDKYEKHKLSNIPDIMNSASYSAVQPYTKSIVVGAEVGLLLNTVWELDS